MKLKVLGVFVFALLLVTSPALRAQPPTSRLVPFFNVTTSLPPSTASQPVTVQLWDATVDGTLLFSEPRNVDTGAAGSILGWVIRQPVGSIPPAFRLAVSNAGGGLALQGLATGPIGLHGESTALNGAGVVGDSHNGARAARVWGRSAMGLGLVGTASAGSGTGVWGQFDAAGANGIGVLGTTREGGWAVRGQTIPVSGCSDWPAPDLACGVRLVRRAMEQSARLVSRRPPMVESMTPPAPYGVITSLAGNGVAGFGGDDGPATGAGLNNPGGVAMDGSGNVFIADTSNHRIRLVAPGP